MRPPSSEKKNHASLAHNVEELNPVLLRPFLAPDKQAPGLRFLACQARRGDVRGRVSCILPYERAFFCYSGEHKNVKTLMFACLNNTLSRRSDLLYSSHSLSPRQGHLGRWTLPPPRSLDVEEEKIRLGLGKRLLRRLPHTFTNRARELKPEI